MFPTHTALQISANQMHTDWQSTGYTNTAKFTVFVLPYRRCWKCRPQNAKQKVYMLKTLLFTWSSVTGMPSIWHQILCFNSSNVWRIGSHTMSFKLPHKQKSNGIRLGDQWVTLTVNTLSSLVHLPWFWN